MKEIEEGSAYSHSDGRLVSSEHHVSFVLPEGLYGTWGDAMSLLKCDDVEDFFCGLYLRSRNDSDQVWRGWIEQIFEDSKGDLAQREADIGPLGGHAAIRFKSDNDVGFRVEAIDEFGNGLMIWLSASASAGDRLLEIIKDLVGSIQFVHSQPSDQKQQNRFFLFDQ